MMVLSVCADRWRRSTAIYDGHYFKAFSAFCRTDIRATALGRRKRRVDEALLIIWRATLTKLVGNMRQAQPYNLIAIQGLKPAMERFVLG